MPVISRAAMMRNMQAFDIDAEQLARDVKNDALLRQVYFAILPAQFKIIHLDEPAEAHAMMADYFGMLKCPYCPAHLYASAPDAREEGVEA